MIVVWHLHTGLVAASTLLLVGCGAGWTHPSNPQAPLAQDRYACEQHAAAQFPVHMVPSGPGHFTPEVTRCERQGPVTTCTRMPGQFVPSPLHDVNRGYRSQSYQSCMQARGYEWKWSG